MDMSFAAAVSGVQTVIKRQEIAGHNVANVNTPGFEEMSAGQTEQFPVGVRIGNLTRTPNPDAEHSNTDLAKEAVIQLQNKNELAADVSVIKVQDKMVGALLDIIA